MATGADVNEAAPDGIAGDTNAGRSFKPDTEAGVEKWVSMNAEFAKIWPNITAKKEPPADGKEWEGVPDKFEKYFSPEPGTGN